MKKLTSILFKLNEQIGLLFEGKPEARMNVHFPVCCQQYSACCPFCGSRFYRCHAPIWALRPTGLGWPTTLKM